MMKSKKNRYTLHITISTLFVSLIIVFGMIISWQNYKKISEIIITSGNQVFDQLNRELLHDLQATRNAVTQAIDMLALSPLIHADSLSARLKALPQLTVALRNEPDIAAIQVAYGDGDYFIVRSAGSNTLRRQFHAPEQTAFIVDHIDFDASAERRLQRLFFDPELQVIGRDSPVATQYDPRNRPWYRLAMKHKRPMATKPYLFYFFERSARHSPLSPPHRGWSSQPTSRWISCQKTSPATA